MAFWISLAVFLVGVLGGLVYAALRGIALWRRVKRAGKGFGAEIARIAEASEGIQAHLDRARLEVQLQAVREARHTVRRLLWVVPGV